LTLSDEIVETVGREIAGSAAPERHRLSTEDLMERFGVSRTAVRDAVKILEGKRMVEVRRKTGLRVLPVREWHVLDPQVIRWRLLGADGARTTRTLTVLREGFEPVAARLAAENPHDDVRGRVERAVQDMAAAEQAEDAREFLAADIRFHASLIDAADNEYLTALGQVIQGALEGQTAAAVLPRYRGSRTVPLHAAIADAVVAGRPADAEAAAHALFAHMREDLGDGIGHAG
jgi:DNA-binding FadR family transcriptional regulator